MIINLERYVLKVNNKMGWNRDAKQQENLDEEDLHYSNIILKNIKIIKRNLQILKRLKKSFKESTDQKNENEIRKDINFHQKDLSSKLEGCNTLIKAMVTKTEGINKNQMTPEQRMNVMRTNALQAKIFQLTQDSGNIQFEIQDILKEKLLIQVRMVDRNAQLEDMDEYMKDPQKLTQKLHGVKSKKVKNSLNDLQEKVEEIRAINEGVKKLVKLIEQLQNVIQGNSMTINSIDSNMQKVNDYMVETVEQLEEEYLSENPFVLAPMVNHSDLPFRMLTRKYKTGLCFTPMLNSRLVVNDKKYFKKMFHTSKEDRPLVVQLCGDSPELVTKAAKKFENCADIIDLNLGCPQNIAKKGNYGAYLLENEELVLQIVKNCVKYLKIPFSCKIRIFPDKQRTLKFAKKLEQAGICMLTVHGRTKEQNKHLVGKNDFDIIREIKESLSIPVISNGGVSNYKDTIDSLKQTKCDGVMSAEGILEYPAIFDYNEGKLYDMDQLVQEYLECVKKYEDEITLVKSHLFKMMFTGLQCYTDLRKQLSQSRTLEEYEKICEKMRIKRKNWKIEDKLGWYHRHQSKNNTKKQKQIDKQDNTVENIKKDMNEENSNLSICKKDQ